MDSTLKSTWWLWWTNPLIQMHLDQKKRLIDSSSDEDSISYEEIEALRSTLRLEMLPEEGIISDPYIGLLSLLEDKHLYESHQKLSAVTFDNTILKLSPVEWDEKFDVKDKDHIRGLITFKRDALNKSTQSIVQSIEQACENWEQEEGILTFSERFKVVAALYLSYHYPCFARRWFLTLSDSVLFVMDRIRDVEDSVLQAFFKTVEPELIHLIQFLQKQYAVSYEPDFETIQETDD